MLFHYSVLKFNHLFPTLRNQVNCILNVWICYSIYKLHLILIKQMENWNTRWDESHIQCLLPNFINIATFRGLIVFKFIFSLFSIYFNGYSKKGIFVSKRFILIHLSMPWELLGLQVLITACPFEKIWTHEKWFQNWVLGNGFFEASEWATGPMWIGVGRWLVVTGKKANQLWTGD